MILYTKDAGGAGREQMAMQKYLTFMNRNDLITSLKQFSLKEKQKKLNRLISFFPMEYAYCLVAQNYGCCW